MLYILTGSEDQILEFKVYEDCPHSPVEIKSTIEFGIFGK